jgi:hypothetical protein
VERAATLERQLTRKGERLISRIPNDAPAFETSTYRTSGITRRELLSRQLAEVTRELQHAKEGLAETLRPPGPLGRGGRGGGGGGGAGGGSGGGGTGGGRVARAGWLRRTLTGAGSVARGIGRTAAEAAGPVSVAADVIDVASAPDLEQAGVRTAGAVFWNLMFVTSPAVGVFLWIMTDTSWGM